ncbi:MAG TPA: acetylornithine/succinylornithine family transaminase [Thermoanaerobaculia bacterium]|nr:acetylornithine/succinylornithine family transaminase [Thermoanaerobaculia bacterium]
MSLPEPLPESLHASAAPLVAGHSNVRLRREPHAPTAELSADAVEAREAQFIVSTYARAPFHPRSGKGAELIDIESRRYWDLLGGIAVNALGHRHPRLMRALREESRNLLHVSNLYYHPAQGALAETLTRLSGLSRAFFCNSGTEANEAALKFARLKNPGRSGVVALDESFHGRTAGSLSLTGHDAYRAPFLPLLPGVLFVAPNDIEALQRAVTTDTSAIFLEPVMGEGGIIPLTSEYLVAARRIADASGALLVFDEIQCGLGRTGGFLAFQNSGVVPDMVTIAKALGGGLPLAAVLTGPALEGMVKPGHHGTTFGGNPIACRLATEFLGELEDRKLIERVASVGTAFGAKLTTLQKKLEKRGSARSIVDVRGSGLMWGIELNTPATPVVRALLARGFVVGSARERVLRLLPPYIVPMTALNLFVKALEEVLQDDIPGS